MNFKYLICIVTLCISMNGFAQEKSIKPESGDIGTEVNFSPLSNSPVRINQINFRFFRDNNVTQRVGLFLGAEVQKLDEDRTTTTFEINVKPGIEKHYEGTDRLSPYIGGELDLAVKLSKYKDDDDEVIGAWDDFGTERGFVRFGANFIIGADYYFTKRIYIGTEFGYGLQFIKFSDIKAKVFGIEVEEEKGGSTFQLGPNYNGSLRLGFTF